MNKDMSNPGFSVIPKGEHPCIWMDAGLVNFKLCDRDFQCETCPFNKAMEVCYGDKGLNPRNSETILRENFDSTVPPGLWRFRLDTSLYMSSCHTWLRPMGVNRLRVGLDDFIITLLGGVDRVVLPQKGKNIKNGDPIAEVFKGRHVFTVISPVDGLVTGVNEQLIMHPGMLIQEPSTGGYLCELETQDISQVMRVCKTGKQLLRWYYHEIEWVEKRLTSAIDMNRAALGETAFDGGMIAPLSEILPDDVYREVVSGLLGSVQD